MKCCPTWAMGLIAPRLRSVGLKSWPVVFLWPSASTKSKPEMPSPCCTSKPYLYFCFVFGLTSWNSRGRKMTLFSLPMLFVPLVSEKAEVVKFCILTYSDAQSIVEKGKSRSASRRSNCAAETHMQIREAAQDVLVKSLIRCLKADVWSIELESPSTEGRLSCKFLMLSWVSPCICATHEKRL